MKKALSLLLSLSILLSSGFSIAEGMPGRAGQFPQTIGEMPDSTPPASTAWARHWNRFLLEIFRAHADTLELLFNHVD